MGYGILDDGCADYLMKAPEHVAKDIVKQLGPEVRNPSAFITRSLKKLQLNPNAQQPAHVQAWQPPAAWHPGKGAGKGKGVVAYAAPVAAVYQLTIYSGGVPVIVDWHSRDQALQDLMNQGILDQPSADYLTKIP